jgi:hypothetical protein
MDLVGRAIYEDLVVMEAPCGCLSLHIKYQWGPEITNVSLSLSFSFSFSIDLQQ